MPFILNIDTATEYAGVCLSNDEEIVAIEESIDQKNHASFLQPAIKNIMNIAQFQFPDIDAIAVTAGPGSYTGLRVGLSSAKALCYALNKPLILLSTLQVMAVAAIKEFKNNNELNLNQLFCPMIDARRMEVFTAIYNINLQTIVSPLALALNDDSFSEELKNNPVIFSGSGSTKFQNIVSHPNASFATSKHNAGNMATLSSKAYNQENFADLAYSEPQYLKDFFSSS